MSAILRTRTSFSTTWARAACCRARPRRRSRCPRAAPPNGLAVSPNSKNVYADSGNPSCGSSGGEVFHLTADATGHLTLQSTQTLQAPRAGSVGVSPDGRSLYATGQTGGAPFGSAIIYQYNLSTTGVPSAKTPASTSSGFTFGSLVIDRAGKNLYVTSDSSFCNDKSQQVSVLRFPIGSGGLLGSSHSSHVARPSENAERAESAAGRRLSGTVHGLSDFPPSLGGVGDPVAVELEEIVGGCHQPPF